MNAFRSNHSTPPHGHAAGAAGVHGHAGEGRNGQVNGHAAKAKVQMPMRHGGRLPHAGCGGGHGTTAAGRNLVWTESLVTPVQRRRRNAHRGAVVWLTGYSGSGKSTLAHALEADLFRRGMQVYVLDGDNVRHGLNSNLGFSPEDRVENIRRVAEVAKLMADAGLIVITAFISPYSADRQSAREIARRGGCEFMEVFVDTPLTVCEERDPKQLYKKARAGKIKQFTGIDAPYEAPSNPELVVRTTDGTPEELVEQVLKVLLPKVGE